MTVLWLGLRSGELCRLKVRDVDRLSDGTWLWIDGDVKTESSRRRLEVPADLAALLGRRAGERPAHIVASQRGHTSHRVTEEHYLAEGTAERGRIRRMLRVMEGGRKQAVEAEGTEQERTEQEVTEQVAVGKVR